MIEFDHVHKAFGNHVVIEDLSLRVEDGEFFVLVGPSGSGKSTLLRTVNRLTHIDRGQVRVHGKDVATQPIEALRRGIGYAIQSVGLFPHRTVAENIAAVPHLLRWPQKQIDERVAELMALLKLDERAWPIATRIRFPAARRSASAWRAHWQRGRKSC